MRVLTAGDAAASGEKMLACLRSRAEAEQRAKAAVSIGGNVRRFIRARL
jgi:hypothetical protein